MCRFWETFYSEFFKQTCIHHFITDLLIKTYFWASVTDIKQITKGIEGQFYDKKYSWQQLHVL